ncbi:MAG: amidohydrolase family protein [Chthoniobacterales bacterium]
MPIIDVHAHYFSSSSFTEEFLKQAEIARGEPVDLVTNYTKYWAMSPPDTKTIVFGGKARLSGVWTNNEDVANLVKSDPGRLTGFLSVDISQPGWEDDLRHGHQKLGLRGVKLLPMYAGFYPNDPAFNGFWEYVCRHDLPVVLHAGTTFVRQAPLDCTRPIHIDDVAIRYPKARIWMAHLGHPYEGETIAVIRKHPYVYADVSALFYRPWQLFHSLMLVQEYGVWDKLLFGSDFPFTTVNDSIAGLREVGKIKVDRFRLPAERIEELIHRDTLELLHLN